MNLPRRLRFFLKASTNIHIPGGKPDIFLFATPRGGSTWVMEILATQPRIKYFDEPLNPRRDNVAYSGLFPDYDSLMPESGDSRRIVRFLKNLQEGKHGYMNVTPFRRSHRFFTNRCVFKIHEIEHLMRCVEDECRGQLVYLLRHPIATSISRHTLPRLELFLKSAYYESLLNHSGNLARIRSIARIGSDLQRAVISWCYENLVALRTSDPSWLLITYEEMVLNPNRACDLLLTRLGLPDRNAMLVAFERPAVNITMSHADTLAAMSSVDVHKRRRRLITKWLDSVDDTEIAQAAEILQLFELSVYRADKPIAMTKYLHFADTAEKI